MNGKQLKNSILQWAIQGKLVPQDPNDEPASVLLERIREEKARLVKEGKIKKDKNESIIFRGDDNSHYEKFADGTVKCIDDEIPFEIPEGWEWCRLTDMCSICTGATFKKDDATQSQRGTRILRGGNILPFQVKLKDDDIFIPSALVKENILLKQNDIVTPAVTSLENIGKMARIEADMLNTTVGGFVFILRPYYNNDVLSQYMLFVMSAPPTVEYMRSITNKSGQAFYNIGKERLATTLIPLPPYAEQRRLTLTMSETLPHVEKYARHQADLDKLNSNLTSSLKKSILQEAIQGKLVPQDPNDEPASVLLERIREEKQRLLKEGKLKRKDITDSVIFKGEDNKYYEQIGKEVVDISEDIPFEIPDSWSWSRLRDICSICTGATFKKEDATQNQNGVRILRGGNIQPFRICIKDDDIFIPYNAVKVNILLRQNDIVTPAVTSLENIGKMARVEIDMPTTTVGGFVFILRPYLNDDILSEYLLYVMSAPATVEFMRSITNKSGQAFYNIGKERLSIALIPVPPHGEQRHITRHIQHLFSKLS